MKKIRIILAAMAAIVITGCRCDNVDKWHDDGRIKAIVRVNTRFDIMCDMSTNMAYLLYEHGNRAGLTAYLDSDGKPMHCDAVNSQR